MGITIDGHAIREVYAGSEKIREIYHGSDLVWTGRPTSRVDYQWHRAYEQPLKIMFMGSSTTEGYGTTRNESFVNQFVSAICKQAVGAAATAPVKQNTGTVTERTAPGFHFLNAGVGGTTTANYCGPDRGTLFAGWKPDIVFHMIGSNDYAQQVPLSDVRYHIRDIMGDANNRDYRHARHIFVHSYRREDRDDTGITWAEYGEAIADVCSEYGNTEFLDAYTWWEELRDPNVDYLQDDRVHARWTGNYLLARAVGAALRFDEHENDLIFHIDASEWTGINDGQGVGSITQDPGTLVQNELTSTGDLAPIYRAEGGTPSLDFASGQRRMETGAWDGVHSLPITVYIVTSSMGDGGSNSQPFFTRSVSGDDGYLWAWRDRDADLIKGASNTAFNDGVGLDRDAAGHPAIIVISYLPSGHIRYYINSLIPSSTGLDRPSEGNGPWMRSLKLGTNTGNTDWSEARIREMYWHHGMDPDTVKSRIATLADKHGIEVTTRVSDWTETTSTTATTDTVPDWADTIEIVAVGAGGGGAGGGIISTGDGGRAGSWASTRVQATAGATLTAQPGRGGAGGSSNSSNGSAGGASTALLDGQGVLSAAGGGTGTSTNGNNPGRGAGTHTAYGRTFTGGGNASNGQTGNPPGGGGGPGAPLNSGLMGAVGRVWWRFVAH